MISLDFSNITLKLGQKDGKTTVFDPVRKKWLVLTPEEHVRQYLLQYLVGAMEYPIALLAVEKMIKVGNMNKRRLISWSITGITNQVDAGRV